MITGLNEIVDTDGLDHQRKRSDGGKGQSGILKRKGSLSFRAFPKSSEIHDDIQTAGNLSNSKPRADFKIEIEEAKPKSGSHLQSSLNEQVEEDNNDVDRNDKVYNISSKKQVNWIDHDPIKTEKKENPKENSQNTIQPSTSDKNLIYEGS